jgi:small subunit ribosomal protein S5
LAEDKNLPQTSAENQGQAQAPAGTPPPAGAPRGGAGGAWRRPGGGPNAGPFQRGGGGGRFRDGDRSRRGGRDNRDDGEGDKFEDRVVKINRCATVVKGGRRFSFSALVVVGDREGSVGFGFGKANEVPPSVEKAIKEAKKSLVKVALKGSTIPHQIYGKYRTSKVVLVPAVEGTGIIAGAAVRAVVECVGIQNVLSKVFGSTNPINVVKATMDALKNLRTVEEVSRLRGVEVTL